MAKKTTCQKRRGAGLCVQCGKVKTSMWRCEACNKLCTTRIADLRKKRKSEGRCILCGKPATGKEYCDDHLERARRHARRRYFNKTMRDEGLS